MKSKEDIRIRNPFRDPLVTELIEDPQRYGRMFSERILVGETLAVFQPTNAVLTGPQGSGKSMILNLIRYPVLSEWITLNNLPPAPIRQMAPFLGISVNLVRANFHAFGRRSVSKALRRGDFDQALDAACAADFLNHYLFREFLMAIRFLIDVRGRGLRDWLGVSQKGVREEGVVGKIASWKCWFGYYSDCRSVAGLIGKCEERLSVWMSFLNGNIDEIPERVWRSKSTLGEPQHEMGNLLSSLAGQGARLPLFVVIDQYEVLPELNPSFGESLQRIVNTVIKARDPVVFYKIGARTYDWGRELRVWGADSRIEVQRDYVKVDLTDVLMRGEDPGGWIFPEFAQDVALKRLIVEGRYRRVGKHKVKNVFGSWLPETEAPRYFRRGSRDVVLRGASAAVKGRIKRLCGRAVSPLELRLAAGWALAQERRGKSEKEIIRELGKHPWRRESWRKERIMTALLQIASQANQKKFYYGWKPLIYLSGANISAFLLLASEVWDMAARRDFDPLENSPLPPRVQTDGILVASERWADRDKNENPGGRRRYEFVRRLGPSIHDALIADLAMSNPGHSGFSLRESDLGGNDKRSKLARFLENGVSWAIFEERPHTSKQREGESRRKWYLHPLLSPVFSVPYIRVKEPLYVDGDTVYAWIFENARIRFSPPGRTKKSGSEPTPGESQYELPLGENE